jgi:hypothetical protein
MLRYHFNPVSLKFKQRIYDNFCQVNIDHKLVTFFILVIFITITIINMYAERKRSVRLFSL